MITAVAKAYLKLGAIELPRYLTQPRPLERAEMAYQDEAAGFSFPCFFPHGIDFVGKHVLDVGTAHGGRPVRWMEIGAASVTAVDPVPDYLEEARAFADSKGQTVSYISAAAEALPFPDRSFDVATSYDCFEHVCDLEQCLRECYRVLRPGGTLYAVFPPYHHPLGGSHLHGYLSKSPAPNVLFPRDTLLRAVNQLLDERQQTYRPPLRPSDVLPCVNGTSIRSLRRLLHRVPFTAKRVYLMPMISPARAQWERWRMRYWHLPFKALTYVPFLNEVCTERIVCELTV